jgi:hypothetical protein
MSTGQLILLSVAASRQLAHGFEDLPSAQKMADKPGFSS